MKYGVYEVLDCIFADYETGKELLVFDTLKISSPDFSHTAVEMKGDIENATLHMADHSKALTLNITDALLSNRSLSFLSGQNLLPQKYKKVTKQDTVDIIWDKTGLAPMDGIIYIKKAPTTVGTIKLEIGDKGIFIPLDPDYQTDLATTAAHIAAAINNNHSKFSATTQEHKIIVSTEYLINTMPITIFVGGTGLEYNAQNLIGGQTPAKPNEFIIKLQHNAIPETIRIYHNNKVFPIKEKHIDPLTFIVEVDEPATWGKQATVSYEYYAKNTQTINFTSKDFPDFFKVTGETLQIDECSGELKTLILTIPKAHLNTDFTLNLSAEFVPSEYNFKLTALRDCESDNYLEWTQLIDEKDYRPHDNLTVRDFYSYIPSDDEFVGDVDGEFKYVGTKSTVVVPESIRGVILTSIKNMFQNYQSFENKPMKVISFNPRITSVEGAFEGLQTSALDLTHFDTTNVENFKNMFKDANIGTDKLNISTLNTSSAITFESMFENSQVGVLDLQHFSTSKVKNFKKMFYNNLSLGIVKLQSFDFSLVTIPADVEEMLNTQHKVTKFYVKSEADKLMLEKWANPPTQATSYLASQIEINK